MSSDGSLFATGIADINVVLGGVYERIVLLAGSGDDTVSITPGATTTFELDGGAGTDTLEIDLSSSIDPTLEIIPTLDGAEGDFTFTGDLPVAFVNFESVDITGTIDNLSIREDLSPDFANDGSADTITLSRAGAALDVDVNGIPQIGVSFASVGQVTVEGSADSDTLVVDNTGALINRDIFFNGNDPIASPGDKLVISGDPGIPIDRETYTVGATQDAGTVVLDPNDSAGPGAVGALDGDEQVITFTGLEPIDTSTPAAVFDVILTAAADTLRIQDGGLLSGVNSIEVVDVDGTFETFRFANKSMTRLSGNSGADTFLVEYTTAAAGLATLEAYGQLAPGIPGPADDNATDSFTLHSTAPITTSLFGQGGSDRMQERDLILDGLNGVVNVVGGESVGDNDYLSLQDNADVGPDTVTITDAAITGAAPATVNYDEFEKIFFESTAGDDTIDILSTSAEAETFVTGNGGSDTITVGNQTSEFDAVYDGSLMAILGPLAISGDFSGIDGVDTLNVDASAAASLDGAATIRNATYAFDLAPTGTTISGPVTVLDGFAPAPIRYFYDSIAPLGLEPRLEYLNVLGSTGADDITVEVTTAIEATTIDARQGEDVITVNGDALSAANTFSGGDDADQFALNITASLGDTSFVDLTALEFAGNDPAADSAQRDRLEINDDSGAARDLVFDYLDTPGDLDINPGPAGGLGAGAEDVPVMVRTMETISYNGTGARDSVVIEGTSGDDQLTVAPLADDLAMVFLAGNPWDGPSDPQAFADAIPGVGGGGSGPDLQLSGLDSGAGLAVNDDAGTNRLFIYALTEGGLNDGTASDPFGFGAGQILPDPGVGNAYDTIVIDDMQTRVNAFIPVLYDTTDFVQADPEMDAAIILNTGFEGNPPAVPGVDVADDIYLTTSSVYRLVVNAGDPDPVTTGIVPPDGDRLNVESTSEEIDIYSDKSTPPIVSVAFGGGVLPFGFSSIENLFLDANGGTINLIGDNNNTTPQHDNFVVVGRNIDGDITDGGYQEVELFINGSYPIWINNVQFLNAVGYEETDTLDVTPYADNTPRGWGIDVRFDEGNPMQVDGEQIDLLIYNTVMFNNVVSEDIVIQPSSAEGGELRVTNGAFGTPIVTISYMNNLDIIVIDGDGGESDTDTLTLRGTNPDNVLTSGNEIVTADFSAAGDLANPLVVVEDADPVNVLEPLLYRVRDIQGFDSVTIDTLDGDDTVSVVGRDNGSVAVNVLGAETLVIPGTADAADDVAVLPGTSADMGSLAVQRAGASAATSVQFDGTHLIVLDGGGGTGTDTVLVQGTGGDDAVGLDSDSEASSTGIETSFGPQIAVQSLGSDDSVLSLMGHGGDDAFSIEPIVDVDVNVNGGDPTASDSVVVKGTTDADAFTVTPTADDAGTVVVNLFNPVNLMGVEHVTLDGLGGDDLLVIATDSGDSAIELTPGATGDAGDVQVDSWLPISFQNLGADGIVTMLDNGGTDTFIYNGTDGSDAFTVGNGTIFLDARVPVLAVEIEHLTLRGKGGDDTFTVQAQSDMAILVEGDEPSGSDTLNYAAGDD